MVKRPLFVVILLIFGGLLGAPAFPLNKNYFQNHEFSEDEYLWIWDELLDPDLPQTISGDDSVFWGSSLGPYYNSSETIAKLKAAAEVFPSIVSFFSIGKSYYGKEIGAVRVTLPLEGAVAVKYEFALVGAHHAREAITVIDSLFFLDRLLFNYMVGDPWTIQLLSQAEIYIVPLLNPDGLDHTAISPWQRKNMHPIDEDGDGFTDDELEIRDLNGDNYVEEYFDPELNMWIYESSDGIDNDTLHGEENPGGVDLNRNYPFEFIGPGSSTNPRDDTYRGPTPLSEPETQAWVNFSRNHHFFTSLSLHSGIEAIIYPWGYTSTPPPDEDTFVAITNVLQSLTGFPTWDEVGGYGVNGEWGDWMYGDLDSLAFTIETYGNQRSYRYLRTENGIERYGGIWNYFNPEPGKIYETTVTGVQPMIDYLASVPLQGIVSSPNSVSQLSVQENSTHVSVSIEINGTEASHFLAFETINLTDMGWYPLHNEEINSTISAYDFEVPKVQTPSRIYVGSASQGFAFHLNQTSIEGNFSISPIEGTNGPVDVGVRPLPSSPTHNTTSSSPFQTSQISTNFSSSVSSTNSETLVWVFGMLQGSFLILLVILRRSKSFSPS